MVINKIQPTSTKKFTITQNLQLKSFFLNKLSLIYKLNV